MAKYQIVRDQIRSAIGSQQYGPGERLPTDAEFAVRFDTSRLTIIRALRELESEGLVLRKAGSGTFVSMPEVQERHEFGLLIPDLGEGEIFEPICRGMARAGESAHQGLLWGQVPASAKTKAEQARELCRYFISRRVSGIFFVPLEMIENKDEVNHQIAGDLDRAGIPIVLLDRCIYSFPERSHYDLVGIDNVRAAIQITDCLLKAGVSRPAFVFRPGSAPTSQARIAGYREALWRRGIQPESKLIAEFDPADFSAFRKFFDSVNPDGIVCSNDYTAGQIMHSAMAAGLEIPRDLKVVGFDDVKYASLLPVPLTTVHQPCADIGAAAVAAMLQRIENPDLTGREILLDFKIIVRQSCGSNAIEDKLPYSA